MNKVVYIFKEMLFLIKAHKLYFLAPIFITLAILAIFIYYAGPAVIISLLYAGI